MAKLQRELEAILGAPVEIVPASDLKPGVWEEAEADAVPSELLAHEPTIPWREVAAIRGRLAHRYFDTTHAILQSTVEQDIPELDQAVERLYPRVTE
ncbi:MAG: HepT-like ribonuclease domain-containing protein [Actinopolymorphaceae bacterium]